MQMPFEFVRKKFLSTAMSDYANNDIGGMFNFLLFQLEQSDAHEIADIRMAKFLDLYSENGRKNWYLEQRCKSWVDDWNKDNEQECDTKIKTLSELLAMYPDLKKDINYADFLREKYNTRMADVLASFRDGSISKDAVTTKTEELRTEFLTLSRAPDRFNYEKDSEYQKYVEEKRGEAGGPQEVDRK